LRRSAGASEPEGASVYASTLRFRQSIERYSFVSKKRILRIFSRETRLAVRFATQPLANVSRAFAMSMRGVSTGTPTACTSITRDLVSQSARSRSWIMRSRITSTSMPRGTIGASRCASMNRGALRWGRDAWTAGLKRSTWPTRARGGCRGVRPRPPPREGGSPHDASLRAAHELDELMDLGVRFQVSRDLRERLGHVELRAVENAVGALQLQPDLRGNAAAVHSDRVEAARAERITGGLHVR